MAGRHAHLIIAHTDFEILGEILKLLDHERNDIFIHIDRKVRAFPREALEACVKKGRLFFVPRLEVNWGGYSQIRCEVELLAFAVKQGLYDYYHMNTGATAPLRPAGEILRFFDDHPGREFIGTVKSRTFLHRVYHYNLFNEIGKSSSASRDLALRVRDICNAVQDRVHYVYGPARGISFRKGFAYWSLTQEAAELILSRRDWIQRVFSHSICGDEVFVQTILCDSPLAGRIFDPEDEYGSCLRYVKPVQSWKPEFSGSSAVSALPENSILPEDIPGILESGKLFALKFTGAQGLEAVRTLAEALKG